MSFLLWLACFGPSLPPGVPTDARAVTVREGNVAVDGASTDGDTAVAVALTGASNVWVDADGVTPWRVVRNIRRALPKTASWWFGAHGPIPSPRGDIQDDCPNGPVPWKGVGRVYALHLWEHNGAVSVSPTVRFRPIVDLGDGPVAVEAFPARCWAPSSCVVLTDGPQRTACEDGLTGAPGFPDQLQLTPEEGACLGTWRRSERTGWVSRLTQMLTDLGPREQDESLLLPASDVPVDALTDALTGFAQANRSLPMVPGLDVQGGAPTEPRCPDALSTAPLLDLGEGYWLGQRIAEAVR